MKSQWNAQGDDVDAYFVPYASFDLHLEAIFNKAIENNSE